MDEKGLSGGGEGSSGSDPALYTDDLPGASFERYMQEFHQFARYPGAHVRFSREGIAYLGVALAGEVGEVCNILKKHLRDGEGLPKEEQLEALQEELGDCLWYLMALVRHLALLPGQIMATNIQKCIARQRGAK